MNEFWDDNKLKNNIGDQLLVTKYSWNQSHQNLKFALKQQLYFSSWFYGTKNLDWTQIILCSWLRWLMHSQSVSEICLY